MSEPRLEDIGDYNTLKGEKKRVVWAVIIAGLIIGVIYTIASDFYEDKSDRIDMNDTIKMVPMKYN